MATKIYIVVQESNIDAEIGFYPTPCASREVARKEMDVIIKGILEKSYHFGGRTAEELEEDFEIERDNDSFYINDPSDDYYENIYIVERELVV